ncbi:chromosome segregation ATPase [Afipia sp. Root123D2]|nr:chromosome segregation ATPase [Afipia sp. Root123D2]
MGQSLLADAKEIQGQYDRARQQLADVGALSVFDLEARRNELQQEINGLEGRIAREKADIDASRLMLKQQADDARKTIVETREIAILQEVGVYEYRHPLTDAVAYQDALRQINESIKAMVKKDGGAILSATNWQVNGSETEGRRMVGQVSKLMLRAFNAEVDNIVRGLKPYKLDSALARLQKVAETIQRLGTTMEIRISPTYFDLRVKEVELTADFLQKRSEEKEDERRERERLREERKAQLEIEREKAKLEKEKQHYSNALEALMSNGDQDGINRLRNQIAEVDHAIETMDMRAANTRAGYVYVISNIGSFGNEMVKVGMTRRLDPMDRIRELSDASVPFNFDVHALFFSNDAVGIETAMHERLASTRVNAVNRRREFFRTSPVEAKQHLGDLAGELLQFDEVPEALEYRQTLKLTATPV